MDIITRNCPPHLLQYFPCTSGSQDLLEELKVLLDAPLGSPAFLACAGAFPARHPRMPEQLLRLMPFALEPFQLQLFSSNLLHLG